MSVLRKNTGNPGRINMDRANRIIKHRLFQEHLEKNKAAEADRRFCRHDMVHFLDVARIGRILNLEEDYGISTELIYAAALLHDIGKHKQYTDGIPHELASAEIAPVILRECGFSEAETECVTEAIRCHRNAEIAGEKDLRGLLYRADKAGRACFACEAEQECNWKNEKKNLQIQY